MRIVLDTNVLMSGIFFAGPPHQILNAWRSGRFVLVLSPEILEEYYRTAEELSEQFGDMGVQRILSLLAVHSELVNAPLMSSQVCSDRDDDKFIACALAGSSKIIVSGDKALLRVSGYKGVEVLRPRQFLDLHLRGR